MGTNPSIASGDIFSIPPRDMSNTPEDSHKYISYKSMPTNSKVHIVDSYYPTSDPSTNLTTHTKLGNSKIH